MGLKIAGETWREFADKYGIDSDGKNKCIICKKEFDEPTDWYCIKDAAMLVWKHEGCKNTGPCKAVVFGESGKELAGLI